MFQGQEKRCVVISTVRSSRDFISHDKLHHIGFLANPKRFNVAITRAACLLVVVGNPAVLAHDPCWGELLRACIRQGAYRGVEPPLLEGDGAEVEDMATEFARLMQMDEEEEEEEEEGAQLAQEGMPMP
eukprot:3924462-Rhodomonas_salina.1